MIDSLLRSPSQMKCRITPRVLVNSFQPGTNTVPFPNNMSILDHDVLTAFLCILELFQALSRIQVLFGLGPPYSKEVLCSMQWYFTSGAVTALISCCLLINSRKYQSSEPILAMAAVLHFELHVYYILNWYCTTSFAIKSIWDWSSSEAYLRWRLNHNGMTMLLFNFTGTLFDVGVHFLLTCMLFHFVIS